MKLGNLLYLFVPVVCLCCVLDGSLLGNIGNIRLIFEWAFALAYSLVFVHQNKMFISYDSLGLPISY